MKPNMSKKEEIEDIIRNTVEQTTKKVLDATVDAGSGNEGKKLSQILKDIKNKPPEDKDKKEVHTHEDDDIDCPSCKTSGQDGHKAHKLHSDGKSGLVCTGPDCKHEYLIIPKTHAEYVCESCGQSHVKIDTKNKELIKNDKCINCGKDAFVPKGYKIDKK